RPSSRSGRRRRRSGTRSKSRRTNHRDTETQRKHREYQPFLASLCFLCVSVSRWFSERGDGGISRKQGPATPARSRHVRPQFWGRAPSAGPRVLCQTEVQFGPDNFFDCRRPSGTPLTHLHLRALADPNLLLGSRNMVTVHFLRTEGREVLKVGPFP